MSVMHDDVPELSAWLATASDIHLKCRRWGHAWNEWRTEQRPEPGVKTRTILRCTRCKQRAYDDLDYLGYSDRNIQYDEEYLAPRGMGHLSREDRALLRLEVDRRIHGGD
jgi:hypothetical protein